MAGYGPFGIEKKLGSTEYGGNDGVVQVGPGGVRVHEPTPSERIGMVYRTDPNVPNLQDALSVDPVTGLVQPL
jgi:hypothetical protein